MTKQATALRAAARRHEPTVHQRGILETLRDNPDTYLTAGKFGVDAPGLRLGNAYQPVPRRTFDLFLQRHWISRQWQGECNGDYRLTDAGRLAIGAPRADEGAL